MAGKASFSFTFGAKLDPTQLIADIGNLQQQVTKAPPLKINTEVGVKTGDAQSILNQIQQQAKSIDEVIVKQATYKNKAGETYTALTQMATKYTDAQGVQLVQTDKLISRAEKGYTKIQEITASVDIGKMTKNIESSFSKTSAEFEKMETNAAKWEARSKTMAEAEAKPIRESIELLREKIALYEKSVSTGQIDDANRYADAVRKQNAELLKNVSLSQRSANVVRGWADNITNAIKQTVSYTLSLGTLRMAQQLLNQAIQYTIELNKEMVAIQVLQVEGAQTDAEIRSLANSYNDLAQQMGVTTLEVAKGSVEWLRQGKTIAQTQELLKASTMLSKLGNIEAAESTEFLTSAINGYGMAAEDAVGIVDKLVAVDNVAATSSKELATALRYSSAVAADAGVSLEQLISYIGVISQTTRQNAEMIGQALKTIFTRMQDIRAGKLDEDNMGINNVAIALERVQIPLMENETEFRDLGSVLEDVATKWDTLNEVEQANIAKAIAGVRQQNMFRVLMANMSEALRLQGVQTDAAGLAMDRYQIYLKSVEAAQNRVTAAAESLWQQGISSGLITNILNTTAGVIELIEKLGGLNTVLIVSIGLLTAFNAKAIISNVSSAIKFVGDLTTVIKNFTLMGSVGSGALKTLLGMSDGAIKLYASIMKLVGAVKTFGATLGWAIPLLGQVGLLFGLSAILKTQELDNLNKQLEKTKFNLEQLSIKEESIKSLSYEIDVLKKLKDNGEASTEQLQRLTDAQNELKNLIPDLNGEYDAFGNFIVFATGSVRDLTDATLDNIEADKQQLKIEQEKNEAKRVGLLNKAYEESMKGWTGGGATYRTKSEEQREADQKAFRDFLATEKVRFSQMGKEAQDAYINALTSKFLQNIFGELKEELEAKSKKDRLTELLTRGVTFQQPVGDKRKSFTGGMYEEIGKLRTSMSKLADIKEKLAKKEFIAPEELETLGLVIDETSLLSGKYELTAESEEKYREGLIASLEATYRLTDAERILVESIISGADASDKQSQALQNSRNAIDAVTNAVKEQNSQGYISKSTADTLINANSELASSLTRVEGGYKLDTQAAYELVRATVIAQLTEAGAANTANLVAAGHYEMAKSMITGAESALLEAQALNEVLKQLDILAELADIAITIPAVGGGGGATTGETATDIEIKRLEKKIKKKEKIIKQYEEEKDALKEQLDLFNDYIDLQKESLERAKDEDDYNKEMAEKAKDLAKIKSRILLLSLDDSEEAMAERIKLEEEAAEQEADITEAVEDRKLEMQLQALDDLQKAFEDGINAQIDAIDKLIKGVEEEIEKIQELIAKLQEEAQAASGAGSAFQSGASKSVKTVNDLTAAMDKLGYKMTEAEKTYLKSYFEKAIKGAKDFNEAIRKSIIALLNLRKIQNATNKNTPAGALPEDVTIDPTTGAIFYERHSGGLIEEHHDGNFAGNLESNEVFAKLLRGEYVSTEGQMDNFLKNILPRFVAPQYKNTNIGTNANNFNVSIVFNGDRGKLELEDIKKTVFSAMNDAIQLKGKKKNAFTYSL